MPPAENPGVSHFEFTLDLPAFFRHGGGLRAVVLEPAAPPDYFVARNLLRGLMTLVHLVFFDFGGGHRAAATALGARLGQAHAEWDVRLVNLKDMLGHVPHYRLIATISEEFYSAMLKNGFTAGSRQMLKTLQNAIRHESAPIEKALRIWWRQTRPDLVVSLIPNFNACMHAALRDVRPGVPYVTVMTDLADAGGHFWMGESKGRAVMDLFRKTRAPDEKDSRYIICGGDYAVDQAHLSGWYHPHHILQSSGMLLRPCFYEPPKDPALTRERLGLRPDEPVALVMFGGVGSHDSVRLVRRLDRLGVQSLVMCGKNHDLLKDLAGKKGCAAIDFTDDIPGYMRLADFFVGKPGPGSISEAVQMRLPIVLSSRSVMVQEQYNLTWVRERKVGIVLPDFRRLPDAVRLLFREGYLEKCRAACARQHNHALFQIPEMLAWIAAHHTAPAQTGLRRGTSFSAEQDLPRAAARH